MTGLRRRVTFGFMGIVVVLVLSGMISFFELSTLSDDTADILGSNRRSGELAREMLSAVRDQSSAFVNMTAFGDRSYDEVNLKALDRLDKVLLQARAESLIPEAIDSMMVGARQLRELNDKFVSAPTLGSRYELLKSEFPQLDSLSKSFSVGCYREHQPIHDKLVARIDDYMTSSRNALAPGAEQLQNNAYRTVTPVFISLVVMIALVLMLYYFVMLYCVQPVVVINRALKDYLTFRVPFAPKSENRDEIGEICERVNALIKQGKMSKE